jgi:hypothetical protein
VELGGGGPGLTTNSASVICHSTRKAANVEVMQSEVIWGCVYMFKIEEHIRGVEKICMDLRVKRLDLVGSAAREDFQPGRSDIDVLVEFEGLEKLFDRYFELKTRLEQQLGSQVDVIQEGAVKNPYIRKSLNRNRVRIYGSRSESVPL